MGEVAERAEPVIQRDQNDAFPGQRDAVADVAGAGAACQRAAVDPNKHRLPFASLRGRPDVEKKAVLVLRLQRPDVHGAALVLRLGTLGAIRRCVAHACPGDDGLRRFPAQIADRRRGVRDAFEHGYAAIDSAGNLPAVHTDHICCCSHRGKCRQPHHRSRNGERASHAGNCR
jgi:hypothetical protein